MQYLTQILSAEIEAFSTQSPFHSADPPLFQFTIDSPLGLLREFQVSTEESGSLSESKFHN